MRTFHIWERGVYQARDIKAEWMRDAVRQYALGGVRKLAGDAIHATGPISRNQDRACHWSYRRRVLRHGNKRTILPR
jgi:hypothetical protein